MSRLAHRSPPSSSSSSSDSDNDVMEAPLPQRVSRLLSDEAPLYRPLYVSPDRIEGVTPEQAQSWACRFCMHVVQHAHTWNSCSCSRVWVCGTCLAQTANKAKCGGCSKDTGRAAQPNSAIDGLVEALRVKCANEGCIRDYELGRGFIAESFHQAQCLFRLETCHECQGQVRVGERAEHASLTCPKRKLPCPTCAEAVPFADWEEHRKGGEFEGMCQGLMLCPNKCCTLDTEEPAAKRQRLAAAAEEAPVNCRVEIRRADEKKHLEEECPRRMVDCVVCHEAYTAKKESHHYSASRAKHDRVMMELMKKTVAKVPQLTPRMELPASYRKVCEEVVHADIERLGNMDFKAEFPVFTNTCKVTLDRWGPNTKRPPGADRSIRQRADKLYLTFEMRPPVSHVLRSHINHWVIQMKLLSPARDGDEGADCSDGFNTQHPSAVCMQHNFTTTLNRDTASFDGLPLYHTRGPHANERYRSGNLEFGFLVTVWKGSNVE
jgi:hypothetical protein